MSGWDNAFFPTPSPTRDTDVSGHAILTNVSLTNKFFVNDFSTATGWSDNQFVKDTMIASKPALAISPNGAVAIAWLEGSYVFAAHRAASGEWVRVQQIGSNARDDQETSAPAIAMSDAGDVVVLWARDDGDLWYTREDSELGWGPPTLLAPGVPAVTGVGNNFQSPYAVGMDAASNAIAVWDRLEDGRRALVSSRAAQGGNWSSAIRIDADNDNHVKGTRLVVEANGAAMVVWAQDQLRANRYVPETGWEGAVGLGTGGWPCLGADGEGNYLVVSSYLERPDLPNIFTEARYTAGSGWSEGHTAFALESDPMNPLAFEVHRIALEPSGNALVVWRPLSLNSGYHGYARYSAGSGWQHVVQLVSDEVPWSLWVGPARVLTAAGRTSGMALRHFGPSGE